MKQVYAAANVTEAYLVRDLLANAGIVSRIFNEHAMGALGDVPMGSAYPQVWIERDHQEHHARQVIDEYESRRRDDRVHVCLRCGESSPGPFDSCWNCSAPFAAI